MMNAPDRIDWLRHCRFDNVSEMASNYDAYVETGHYSHRYPAHNSQVFRVLLELLASVGGDKPILDFGCGMGRYLVPMLEHTSGPVVGYDISRVSLNALARDLRGRGGENRVTLIHEDTECLVDHFASRKAGLAMILFGVLSHMNGRAERLRTLEMLRNTIDPKGGKLVISVPNMNRRFRNLQSGPVGPTGRDVTYTRPIPGSGPFFYHLYHAEGLALDLREAGYRVDTLLPESLLPESLVARCRWLGHLDTLVGKVIPPSWGYGLLAIASRR